MRKKKENFDNVDIMLEGLDENNITSILEKWNEIVKVRKQLDGLEDMLKNKIRVFLKERQWDRYKDEETKISVSITTQSRETLDKEKVKDMLTDLQYAQVVRVSTFEKLSIVDKETRARLSKYVKKDKI